MLDRPDLAAVMPAAPDGPMAVFIDVVESSAPIRYFAQIGHRIPIHATSSGRALLLQYAPEERDALYRKIEFKQYGPSTPISIDAVETEFPASIDRGYCQSFADYSRDLAGVAIPLPIGDRRLSVVVAGPEFRIGSRTFDVAATLKNSPTATVPSEDEQTIAKRQKFGAQNRLSCRPLRLRRPYPRDPSQKRVSIPA
jgi:DNA-binding IclR family transcriptional regulator